MSDAPHLALDFLPLLRGLDITGKGDDIPVDVDMHVAREDEMGRQLFVEPGPVIPLLRNTLLRHEVLP
jgi:hypothetical protein